MCRSVDLLPESFSSSAREPTQTRLALGDCARPGGACPRSGCGRWPSRGRSRASCRTGRPAGAPAPSDVSWLAAQDRSLIFSTARTRWRWPGRSAACRSASRTDSCGRSSPAGPACPRLEPRDDVLVGVLDARPGVVRHFGREPALLVHRADDGRPSFWPAS